MTNKETNAQSSSVLLSAFGAPKGGGGASYETLDFSLPSYGEATSRPSSSSSAPSFTASFPELKLPSSTEEAPAAAEPAGDKEAEKKAAEEEKAAAKKAADEEKAAAKKAAEEEKAAAKKVSYIDILVYILSVLYISFECFLR